jgi:site-specific recombinase XerD
MASVKIVLRQKENKDGTYPLAIRITKDRKTSFIHVGYNVKESDWDAVNQKVKKTFPNSTRLNNLLLKKLSEATESKIELETNKTDTSSKTIKNNLKASKEATFFAQADIYIDLLKQQGKFNRISADKPRIKHFKEFLDKIDISFKDITVPLLNKFKAYLKGTRKVTDRTIVNHLIVIRTIFNQAIKSNIVDQKHYPFGKGKVPIKFPDTLKIGLTPDEVKKIEDLDLPVDSYINNTRNIWLFSFYFAGMRVSDVLRIKWSDLQNDRLYYAMGKNAKAGSLKVPEKALKIISQYNREESVHDLIFPDLQVLEDLKDLYKVQRRISSTVRRLNEHLEDIAEKAGIDKKMTMHIARHTFGNISGDKIPIQMLQKLYRHTSITTTIGYQSNFIHKDADDALNAVIGF